MPRLLLVSPKASSVIETADPQDMGPEKRASFVPLALATLAALTPEDFQVDIWDEHVRGRLEDATNLGHYDIVGVTGFHVHAHRAREVARLFRQRGTLVVVGGTGVSSVPELYRDGFDVRFFGEAEHTWPQFLMEWRAGKHRQEYRQITKPDLASSPPPRWDVLGDTMKHYALGGVQTTRGCPFDCEFCDVIYLFGRRPRHKPIERVLAEVRTLEKLGMRGIFFSDDNFYGDPRYTRDLLRELIALNNGFATPLSFGTQITLNVAKDESVLEMLADANFGPIFIGIESSNKASLIETNKPQNYRTDLVQDVHRIQSYGLPVTAGMIVGFDHDTADIFGQHLSFIQEACIPSVELSILTAPPGTKLWSRLLAERRLIAVHAGEGDIKEGTNIVPKQMTRAELMTGYQKLWTELDSWENFSARMHGFISMVRRRPQVRSWVMGKEHVPILVRQLSANIKEPEGVAAVHGILDATQRRAPFVIGKVLGEISQCLSRRSLAASIARNTEKQLAAERKAGPIAAFIDQRPILIPPGFRRSYDSLFGEVLEQVQCRVWDRSRLPEAIVEIFTDFLARWGKSFEDFQEHHSAELNEITDRTIAAANRASTPGHDARPGEVVSAQRDINQLRVETLKCVERELRRMYRAPQDDSLATGAPADGKQENEDLVETLRFRVRTGV